MEEIKNAEMEPLITLGVEPRVEENEPVVAVPEAEAKVNEPEAAEKPVYVPVLKLRSAIEDENDLVFAEMPIVNQKAEITKMQQAIKRNTICYGRVLGFEETGSNELNILIKRDTLKILVPASDFFAHSQFNNIEEASKEEKFIRYRRKASHMFDAVVSFIPKGLDYNEEGVPFVVASRKEAMDKLQEKHFFAKSADVEVGSVAKASIISAGPRYVTVECLGLEVVIGTGALSAFTYIEDASKEFHNGDGLMVAVEKLEVDHENHKVTASLSHALVERLQAKVETVSERMINGRYKATIAAATPNHYIAIITGLKIRGIIPADYYVGTEPLMRGDDVVMLVTSVNKEKNLVIGRCIKS